MSLEVLFYSKYSKVCESFYNAISKIIDIKTLNMVCIDNLEIRNKIKNSVFKFTKLPCIIRIDNKTIEIYEGKNAWDIFGLSETTKSSLPPSLPPSLPLTDDPEIDKFSNDHGKIRGINRNDESAFEKSQRLQKEAEAFSSQFNPNKGSAPMLTIPEYSTETSEFATENGTFRAVNKKKESATEIAARLRKESADYELELQKKPRN